MLPGLGFAEILVLVVVALVVVGPKDLPKLTRTIGQTIGNLKRLAADFQHSFDEMGRQTELEELRREINALKSGGPIGDIKRDLEEAERDIRQDTTARHKPGPASRPDPAPKPEPNPGPASRPEPERESASAGSTASIRDSRSRIRPWSFSIRSPAARIVFDQFPSYEARGEQFAALARERSGGER